VNRGKAQIDVTVRGCIGCGTRHSSNWTDAGELTVTVTDDAGKTVGAEKVTVHRCAECPK
jgi:hypothetical protein